MGLCGFCVAGVARTMIPTLAPSASLATFTLADVTTSTPVTSSTSLFGKRTKRSYDTVLSAQGSRFTLASAPATGSDISVVVDASTIQKESPGGSTTAPGAPPSDTALVAEAAKACHTYPTVQPWAQRGFGMESQARSHTIGLPLHQPCRHVRDLSPLTYTYPDAQSILQVTPLLPDEHWEDVEIEAPVGAVSDPHDVDADAAYLSCSAFSTTPSSVSVSCRSYWSNSYMSMRVYRPPSRANLRSYA